MEIHRCYYPSKLQKCYLFKFSKVVSFLLLSQLLISTLVIGNVFSSISRIFPTFFILADNVLFLYIGYESYKKGLITQEKIYKMLRIFALISIIIMTIISAYVKVHFGNLESLWNYARESNNQLDVFLNTYKNVNPYKFAVLIPFLFLKKNKYNVLITVIVIINILLVGKRGPLLALSIAAITVYLYTTKGRLLYFKYGIALFFVFFIYITFIDTSLFETIIYRMDPSQHYSATDDSSFYTSGRNELWKIILDDWYKKNIFVLLFGMGPSGASDLLMSQVGLNNAHNTWLEMLYNFGIIGVCIYFSYFLYLGKVLMKMRRSKYKHYELFLFLYVFSFVSTFYTVTYYGGFVAPGYYNLMFAFFIGEFIYIKK